MPSPFHPYQPIWIIPLPDPIPPVDRGTPHKCPICDGQGTVKRDLDGGSSLVSYDETCPTCHGERVLWSNAIAQTMTNTETTGQFCGDGPISVTQGTGCCVHGVVTATGGGSA